MKSLLNIAFHFLLFSLTYSSFQTSFFKEINKNFINKNVIVSPLSAYQVIGLTANGAKGKSLEQMLLALGNEDLEELNKINTEILSTSKDFTTIEIANAVISAFKPKEHFVDIISKYEATLEDLKGVTQVNNWCNLKTHGKIPKILDELDPNTVMILLNAIYFKGTWGKEFPENATKVDTFYNHNDFYDESKAIKTDIMGIRDKFNYYEDEDMQVIELPYTKDSMSAIIILPNRDLDINDYISKLDDDKIQKMIKRMNIKEVQLKLPKFELDFTSTLNEVLKKMGMIEPFDQAKADLTGIRDENDIYISSVVQKAYLKVDEKGTEAAAATVVDITTKSLPKYARMNVNRPFLFILRNKKLPLNYEMMFMAKIEEL